MTDYPVKVNNETAVDAARLRSVKLFVLLFYLVLSMACMPLTAHAAKQPKLNREKITILAGKKKTLKVKNYKGRVQWASTNPYVAKVSRKGVIKAKHMGYTVILAKAGDEILKCRVTVNGRANKKEKPFIFCYEVDRDGATIETGDAYNLAVMGGYDRTWTWTVSNTDYATLYEEGNHVSSMTEIGRKCVLVETFMGKSGTVLVTAKSGGTTLHYNLVIRPSRYDAAFINMRMQVLSQLIRPGMSAQEKCLVVAKWLSDYASYKVTNAKDYSLLVTREGQCYHYARTYDFMMDGTGVPCDYISSMGKPGHAWNQVLIDGAWYNIDVTSFDHTEYPAHPYYYQYFMISDYRYLMKQARFKPYHDCTSTRYDACATGNGPTSPWENGQWASY